MTNFLLRLAFAMAMTLAAMSLVHAQDGAMMKQMDTNGDGDISFAEAEAGTRAQFAQIDANKDGKLSADEFVQYRLTFLKAADSDGNQILTRGEMRAMFMGQLFR